MLFEQAFLKRQFEDLDCFHHIFLNFMPNEPKPIGNDSGNIEVSHVNILVQNSISNLVKKGKTKSISNRVFLSFWYKTT